MFQSVKRVGVALSSAATVLALAAPMPVDARTAETPDVIISPDTTSVIHWCGTTDGGVKFNTGAIGVHVQGPIKIQIVDENPDRVSEVIDDGSVSVYRVIVNGDGVGNAGNGNNDYPYPTKQDLVPPVQPVIVDDRTENGLSDTTEVTAERIAEPTPTRDTDINWVIVCYRANATDDTQDDTSDDTVTDDGGDVLGATTDDTDADNEGQVQGVETLANTGVPAGAVSAVGFTTLGVAYVLMRSSKVTD